MTDWRDPLVWIIAVFIVLDFTYAVAFNLLSDEVRLVFVGVLFLGQGVLGILSLLFRVELWRLRLFGMVLFMLSVWLISHAVFGNPFEGDAALRRLAPVLAGLLFVGYADRLPVRLIAWCACFTISFAVAWAIFQPAYFHGYESDLSRFAPFHGGVEKNAHASSYVIFACVLIIHQATLGKFIHRTAAWGFVAIGAVLIGGYWSTQVQLALVAYFGTYVLMSKRVSLMVRVVAALIFLVVVGGVLVEKETRGIESSGSPTFEAAGAGTGRIGTWIDRVDRLQSRTAFKLVIGEGLNTDNYTSPTWPKLTHSHNLILTYMLESGVIGTIAIYAIVAVPLGRFGRSYLPILVAILAASLVDAGIMHRAMAYMLLWMGVGVMALRVQVEPQIRTMQWRRIGSAPARSAVAHGALQRT